MPQNSFTVAETIPAQPTQSAVALQKSSGVEASTASADAALQKLEKNSGLAFSPGTKVFSHGDGGVPDPSIGFYEWVVVSPSPLTLPSGRKIGDSEVLNLPVVEAARFFESKLNGTPVENPQAAFSTTWQTIEFEFSGTWLRASGADYLVVQQTRR